MTLDVTTLVLGDGPASLTAQYLLLVVATVFFMRMVVLQRIGSIHAVQVTNGFLLVASIVVVNLGYLAGYHLLLAIVAPDGSAGFALYFGAALVSTGVFGIPMNGVAYGIERGKAVRVVTPRYKPTGLPKSFVDMTEDDGRRAQFVARGAVSAYIVLATLGGIVALS